MSLIKKIIEAVVPTHWGKFRMVAFAHSEEEQMPHLALISNELDTTKAVIVRIHSECITGDLFHSQRCDCGNQLYNAMDMISEEGGVLIYLRQEGRGIGIINKLKAYNLQDKGYDTIEANQQLGLEVDDRKYDMAVTMLQELGISKIKLLTNNPNKISAIEASVISLEERLPLETVPNKSNYKYLKTKQDAMGHFLDIKL